MVKAFVCLWRGLSGELSIRNFIRDELVQGRHDPRDYNLLPLTSQVEPASKRYRPTKASSATTSLVVAATFPARPLFAFLRSLSINPYK